MQSILVCYMQMFICTMQIKAYYIKYASVYLHFFDTYFFDIT